MIESNGETAHSDISGGQVIFGWIFFAVAVCITAAIDLRYISSRSHNPAFVKQILFWLLAGAFFNLFVLVCMGRAAAGGWAFGYILEYMLSVDNLFVFQLVFNGFAMPLGQIECALFWGISMAVVLRLFFFAIGTEIMGMGAVPRVFFGLVLVYSGVKSIRDSDDEESDPRENPVIKCITALLPVHHDYGTEPKFFLRVHPDAGNELPATTVGSSESIDLSSDRAPAPRDGGVSSTAGGASPAGDVPGGRLRVTLLFVVVLTLGIIDIIFAVDSVTAKISSIANFGDMADFFLNLTSSAYAMFVLRSLYFVLHMLVHMFRFLNYGVGLVLVFIGVKLVIGIWFEIGMLMSCVAILSMLTLSVCASVILPKPTEEEDAANNPQRFGNTELGDVTPTPALDAANDRDL